MVKRFAGVCLSGLKKNNTYVAIFEYYKKYNKLFLLHIFSPEKIQNGIGAIDDNLVKLILDTKALKSVHFNVPLSLPPCTQCNLICPGLMNCKVDEVLWMKKFYSDKNTKLNPKRLLSPYTERPTELYISKQYKMDLSDHVLGANKAPLSLRANYLNKRLSGIKTFEAFPKLVLQNLKYKIDLTQSRIEKYGHAALGLESRQSILASFKRKDLYFIYESDEKKMVQDKNAFEAMLMGLCGFYKYKKQIEKRPKKSIFPKNSSWPSIIKFK